MTSQTPSRSVQLALIGLGASLLLCTITLARALITDALPAATQQERGVAPTALASGELPSHTTSEPDAMPSNDPFDAGRASLDLVPVENAPLTATAAPSAVLAIRLLGTVLLPNGASFAVCQLPSALPRTVHVGDSIGGLTVLSIDRGHVVLHTARGEKTEIDIVHPGS